MRYFVLNRRVFSQGAVSVACGTLLKRGADGAAVGNTLIDENDRHHHHQRCTDAPTVNSGKQCDYSFTNGFRVQLRLKLVNEQLFSLPQLLLRQIFQCNSWQDTRWQRFHICGGEEGKARQQHMREH